MSEFIFAKVLINCVWRSEIYYSNALLPLGGVPKVPTMRNYAGHVTQFAPHAALKLIA